MATRKKKTAKSESLQVNSACSAETTINILFDQPLKVKAPVLGSMPEASNNSHKKQRLKKSLEKVYQDRRLRHVQSAGRSGAGKGRG